MDEIDWIGILGELAEGKKVYYKMPPNKEGYHRHHIKPQHMDGKDEDGMIYLTQEEHALAHWELWEKFHQSGDLGAAVMLGEGCIDDIDMTGENNPNWKGGITKDSEYKHKQYLKRKAEDPEFLKKNAEQKRKFYHKRKAEDPEWYNKIKAKDPEYLIKKAERNRKNYYKRKAEDPEYLKKIAERNRKYYHKRRVEDPIKDTERRRKSYHKRKAEDPEWSKKRAERNRKYRHKKKAAQAGEVAKLPLT